MEEGRRGSLHICFGDDGSTLFDEVELLTFEIQLNKAMLRRSLSEPMTPKQPRTKADQQCTELSPPVPEAVQHFKEPPPPQRQSTARLPKLLKRLLGPMCRRNKRRSGVVAADTSNISCCV